MSFRLFTLGGLRLEAEGQPATGAPAQRRRLALLALLAAAGDRGITREKAFGYLWPEQSTSRARHLLSESIYVLRRFLGDAAIAATQDDMRVNAAIVWSDVAAFRTALARGDASAAAALYHGPFLDGFFVSEASEFDQWVASEREGLARNYGRALETIAEQQAVAGNTAAAAESWQRLAAHDPYSSRVALRYMEALTRAGDRARAIQHAAAHAARLREDVGVEPDADVLQLAQRLQRTERSIVTAPAAKPGSEDVEKELLPDFEVVRVIGEGSVGRVYLARETALRRLVAIKVLLPEHAAVQTARLRFEREAQAAARIQHPNVATAFRFGRLSAGTPYFVMPYVSGGSLEDRLAASGPLPLEQAKRYIAQIASALAAAHRLGIVHRDVRPANVLYDRDGDRVLLTDFGLAAVIETGGEATLRLTRPGEGLGHVRYASPEQLRGELVTEHADVYSLGIVAFEMLTGRLPFDAATASGLMVAQASAAPRRLGEFLRHGDMQFEALLDRCLNKRPEQRPFVAALCDSVSV